MSLDFRSVLSIHRNDFTRTSSRFRMQDLREIDHNSIASGMAMAIRRRSLTIFQHRPPAEEVQANFIELDLRGCIPRIRGKDG